MRPRAFIGIQAEAAPCALPATPAPIPEVDIFTAQTGCTRMTQARLSVRHVPPAATAQATLPTLAAMDTSPLAMPRVAKPAQRVISVRPSPVLQSFAPLARPRQAINSDVLSTALAISHHTWLQANTLPQGIALLATITCTTRASPSADATHARLVTTAPRQAATQSPAHRAIMPILKDGLHVVNVQQTTPAPTQVRPQLLAPLEHPIQLITTQPPLDQRHATQFTDLVLPGITSTLILTATRYSALRALLVLTALRHLICALVDFTQLPVPLCALNVRLGTPAQTHTLV